MGAFPAIEVELVEWYGNLLTVSKQNTAAWGPVVNQMMGLETERSACKALYEKCQTTAYTKLDVQANIEKEDRRSGNRARFSAPSFHRNDAKHGFTRVAVGYR
jgi:hypothetical protein